MWCSFLFIEYAFMRFIIRFWLQFIHIASKNWNCVLRDRYRISSNGLGLLDLCKQSAAHARYVSVYGKLLGQENQFAEYAVAAVSADEEVCGTHQKYYTHE